jgi:hypothetical protein
LTKKRFIGDAPEKQWDPIAEISALLPGPRLFLDHGRPELLHANIAPAVERLAALVTPTGDD